MSMYLSKREVSNIKSSPSSQEIVASIKVAADRFVAANDFIGRWRVSDGMYNSVRIEADESFGVGASISFDMSRVDFAKTDDGEIAVSQLRVDVGWSSTGRDIVTARACIALYTKLADFGASIQAAYAGNFEHRKEIK